MEILLLSIRLIVKSVFVTDRNHGIYIHTPFCREKCDYCSFYSVPVKPGDRRIPLYVERLIAEVNNSADKTGIINADTLYFGGGTPSILGVDNIARIINHIKQRFLLSADCEITIEINPDHLTKDNLRGFAAAGVNRIVLGVQTMQVSLRKIIGRKGKLCSTADLDLFFSEGDFSRSIDIMGGLPGQTRHELLEDLEEVTSRRPDHISFYLLSVEEGTPLADRFNPDESFDERQLELWRDGIDFLKERGYIHYEISNFSLPGSESRHNMKYWSFQPYAGFGPGAHSFIEGKRFSNDMSSDEYISRTKFFYKHDDRSDKDVIVEYLMTSLRLLRGFKPEHFKGVTGVSIPGELEIRFKGLQSRGLLDFNNDYIRVTDKGLDVFDSIIYEVTEPFL